jgi:hypothetical protein
VWDGLARLALLLVVARAADVGMDDRRTVRSTLVCGVSSVPSFRLSSCSAMILVSFSSQNWPTVLPACFMSNFPSASISLHSRE